MPLYGSPDLNTAKPARMTRLGPIALAASVVVLLLAMPGAQAQANTQRCSPSTTTHTAVVRLPGVVVGEQTCVIRFSDQGGLLAKAWVDTVWKRTSKRTRFSRYLVQARLEHDNRLQGKHTCNLAKLINAHRRGERVCQTQIIGVGTNVRVTGDGAVSFNAGAGRHHRGLLGSPVV